MMDAETYVALSVDKAEKYAKQNGVPLIDGKELLEYAKVN
jgi:3,4-dihydroxy 2-butanone 4-phosphate synthase